MTTRSSGRRGRVPASQSWTEQALIVQLTVLQQLLQSTHVDSKQLSTQCLLLSKILDSLLENNRQPVWRQDLLPTIKQVCRHKESPEIRAALLILLLSVKNAFRTEWLSSNQVTERDEILTTLKVLFDAFITGREVLSNGPMQLLQAGGSAATDTHEARAHLDLISSRFYPRLQAREVFVAVQAKVGYEVLMCDFHVPHMQLEDRVRLYVVQNELTETSNCIITPPQVNILVNGQQVERRVTAGYLDAGPQMPSDVTTMVKVGANVLQIIGDFTVPYIIAVTRSRTIERSARTTELQEYVAPSKAASRVDPTDVDDEVVEGASRVSLRCPISHQRLVTPVKASTCRHLQCFDYDSFLEINEKRPAWRCPCCNRFISCLDIRIDRQMEKVLKETDDKIYEVMFHQDGFWVPVSTDGDENGIGLDASIVDGSEIGREVIDLSDEEEPANGVRQNIDVFQQERKPEAQTLQKIFANKGIQSQPTNPVNYLPRLPVVSVPEFTSVAPLSSPSFTGSTRVVSNRNDGTFVNINGGVLYPSMPETVEMQVPNQPASALQSLSAVNHNFQATFAQSRTVSHLSSQVGPVNRSAPNRGYMPSAQLQQPRTGVISNTGQVNQGETRGIRQRQGWQQAPYDFQNVQDLGQIRPQWRSTGVSQHQLGSNAAQPQNPQQYYANQSPASNSPRQQHPSPGVNPQQRPGNWGSAAHTGQWRSSSSSIQAQVPISAGAPEHHWRPAGRMRGSVASPAAARCGQGPSNSSAALQQRVATPSSVNTFPSTQTLGFTTPPVSNAGAPISFSHYGMDPIPVINSQAGNVSLYNGTTWVNGTEFSSAPMLFSGVQTPEGWVNFDNVNSGTPPGHSY